VARELLGEPAPKGQPATIIGKRGNDLGLLDLLVLPRAARELVLAGTAQITSAECPRRQRCAAGRRGRDVIVGLAGNDKFKVGRSAGGNGFTGG
jgi:hypothetical protein